MLKATATTSVPLDSLSQRMPAGNFLVSAAFQLFHFLHVFLLGHTFAPQWRGSRGRPLPVAGGGSPKLREIRSAWREQSEGQCTTIFRGGQFNPSISVMEKAIKNGSLFLWRNANHILIGSFLAFRFPETSFFIP